MSDIQKYKLGVVDEQQDDIDDFFSFFEDEFDTIKIELEPKPEAVVNNIIEANVDAVAIDYKLMEHNSSVEFNGNALFKTLLSRLEDFPVFLMTQYQDEAKKHRIDPFRIFPKEIMQPDPSKGDLYKRGQDLIDRIKYLIKNYKEDLGEKEAELVKLIEIKEDRSLNAEEEKRLIELDQYIEKALDKESSLSDTFTSSHEEKLSALLKKADDIIREINDQK